MVATTRRPQEEGRATASAPTVASVYAAITDSARSTSSPNAYFASVLRVLGSALASPYATICVRAASETIEHEYHDPAADPVFWKAGVQRFLTDTLAAPGCKARLLRSRDGKTKIALLAAPVLNTTGETVGAIALATGREKDDDAACKLSFLESATTFASYARAWSSASGAAASAKDGRGDENLSRAAASRTPEELAFAITNNLRNKLGCEQVALGVPYHRRIKPLSISGLDDIAKQSTGVRHLRAAMEECLDAGEVIACQNQTDWSTDNVIRSYRLHQQWRAAAKEDAVVSIPLREGEDLVAVLSMRRRSDQPFTEELIEQIRAHVEPFAAALRLLHEANRGLARHVADSVAAAGKSLTTPGRFGRKIIVLLALATVAWTAIGTVDYELSVPCVVRPQQTRHIAAPFEAVLVAAAVIQGDHVQRGDVLCRFNADELQQQRAELLAEIDVFERERDRAMAQDDPVNVQLALANQNLSRAKLAIVETRISRCLVTAPIDGVVVAGDLRKRIGGVLPIGEPLFEIAPLEGWMIELEVPETDTDELAPGLTGRFASHARPEQAQPLRIERIRPRTEVRELRNVCLAEASANLPHSWMRPGMEGVARIDVGRRRVWWVGAHRVLDYLRLKLWL